MKIKEKNPKDDICQYIYLSHELIIEMGNDQIHATWMSTITREIHAKSSRQR